MIDYTQAKPSFFIEDQLPQFVRRDGARFIDFLKTYYDWLERRFVILTLKSKKDFDIEEIIGKEFVFISKEYLLQTEDESFIIIPEDFNEETYLENNYSINFDGINQHGDINHQIFDITSDWCLSLWFNPSF
jgi:predicted nuclease of restriction endonuclease-like (RecB) superfamily